MVTSTLVPGWKTAFLAFILAIAFTFYNRLLKDPDYKLQDALQLEPEYDFVIIGGGSAGAVVANRLSEVDDWTVLLLEAGGHETDLSQIPFAVSALQDTDMDWNYTTAPPKNEQSYCLAMSDHSCKWPRGKVIGGSSAINYMLYVRGNRHDYDNWESLGNKGWGYDEVLKYFLKSEDNSNKDLLQTPFHSSGGYLSVQDVPFHSPLADVFIQAGASLGYENRDINGENQTGFIVPQGTIRNGSRCSTSKAFLVPVQKRPNLELSMFSFVTKIGFEYVDSMPIAKSVTFIKENKEYSVRAKKEIVLSAGAVNSPQILMLSGIGPEEHLRDLGIKLVKNLRVGHNLQDHVSAANYFKVDRSLTLGQYVEPSHAVFMQYFLKSEGPLASLGGVEGLAFVNSKCADPLKSYPDIQFHFAPLTMFDSKTKDARNKYYNLRPDLFNGTEYDHLKNEGFFQIIVSLLRPESKGRVMLRNQDPFSHPIIEPNFLTVKKDVETLVDGMKLALNLVSTPPFKEVNATSLEIHLPGCESLKLFSDEYLECVMRQFTMTHYHPTSTCSMGVGPDAVVDPRLKIIGVKGLRVIDASIMPTLVSGNTNAPAIMIGEKGSDLIKEDWKS